LGSSSGQQPVTQTQSNEPWAPSQASLLNELTGANNLYNANIGYQPYSGQTLAGGKGGDPIGEFGINNYLWGGLNAEQATANANYTGMGSISLEGARNLGHNLIQNYGLSHPQQTAAMNFGDVYGKYGDVYSDATGQENPYLLATIAANDRRISDRVNSSVSGAGRYGSGAHTDVLARSLAEAADPILMQDYQNRQQTRLGALSGQQGANTALGNLLQAGSDTAGKWAQLLPTLNEAFYAPGEHLQNVGKFYQDREQQQLANDIALYNAQQAYPWEQLQRFQAAISGAGAQGGTKVTATTPYTPTTLQRVTGGALSGAGLGSIFGAPGAAIGAGAGGLLGLL
jgi:hypothetical protein